MNRVHIEQQLAALENTQRGILAKLAAGNITDELTAEDKSVSAEVASLQAKLATITEAENRLAAFKPTVPGAASGGGRVTVHDNAEDRPFNGIGDFMLAVARSNHEILSAADPRLRKLASGQNNAVDSEGGFLVGTEVGSEIFKNMYEASELASKCKPLNVGAGANAFELPTVEDTSRADGYRYGGARAYWSGEAASATSSTVKVGKVRIELEKLMALMYATSENLADAAQLGTLVNEFASDEMAFVLDDSIFNGNGAGKPLGILASPALVSVAKENLQTAATVNAANVAKMWAAVLPQAKKRGAWYIHSNVFPQLMLMTSAATSAAQPIFMPPNGFADAPFGLLLGRPIYEIEQAQEVGTVGDIVFADLSSYGLAKKGGIVAAQSTHVRFVNDESAFRFTMRVNGRPIPKAAITNKNGSTTRSAFVALATRG